MARLTFRPMAPEKTPRSVAREVSADKIRAFSSFSDILGRLVERGDVSSYDDLLANKPHLLSDILFAWYRQGQIACAFAQILSRDPEKANWRSAVLPSIPSGASLHELIVRNIDAEALQLIFTGVTTAAKVAELVATLCVSPNWSCAEVPWKFGEKGRSIQVGLRWNPDGGTYNAWVLGIAPFAAMPFTRRFVGAPFCALVLRPSPPRDFAVALDSVTNLPAAHLAHMSDGFGEDKVRRDKTTKATENAKIALLGTDLRSTARAKVTFAFPLWCRDLVGPKLIALPEEREVDDLGPTEH